VMDYGLEDLKTPVYGRKNFADLRALLLEESGKRPVWYFPETSYFIAMDIDVPLFLTDYLLARSRDMDFLQDHHISGQLNFSTGQELGYWLMDWTVALLANSDYRAKPMIGIELLGENVTVWKKIIDFQHDFIQRTGLLGPLSSATLLDEMPLIGHSVHERVLLRDLKKNPMESAREVHYLEEAIAAMPPLDRVKNEELRALLQVTFDRVRHAFYLRKALLVVPGSPERATALDSARQVRLQALARMASITAKFQRYPEAGLFSEQENATSYPFGYGWTAATLHYWEREERIVLEDRFNPLFMNIYNPFRILF